MPNNPKSTTGGEFVVDQEPFQIHSVPALAGFNFEDADPPLGRYIDLNDQLVVSTFGTNSIQGAIVNLRILGLDGIIHPFSYLIPANNSRVANRVFFPLMEGWLLSATATIGLSSNDQSFTFIVVGLARAPLNSNSVYAVLIAGYTNNSVPLCWPETAPVKPTDGPGWYHSAASSVPGAGVDITYTVPAGSRQRVVSLVATLTPSAVVANRLVNLIVDDGANVFANIPTNVTLAASTVNTYEFADSLNFLAPFNGVSVAPIPSNLILSPGFRIRTSTTGIQAADQWSAMELLIADWNDPL